MMKDQNFTEVVTVIIPVYNQEKHIRKCLQSIVNQTYSNLEIIVINDGSTDESGKICEDIAQADERIKVFHIENHGVSYARNLGIELSSGKYINFIDSDDSVETTIIERLYTSIKDNGSDLALCGYTDQNSDMANTYIVYAGIDFCGSLNNFLSILDCFLERNLIQAPWIKLYKSELIQSHNVRFAQDLSFGEDTLFVYEYLTHCNSISSISDSLYYVNSHGQSLKTKIRVDKIDIYLLLYEKLNELFSTTPSLNPTRMISRFFCHSFVSVFKEFYSLQAKMTHKQRKLLITRYISDERVQNYFVGYSEPNLKIKLIRKITLRKQVWLFDMLFRISVLY